MLDLSSGEILWKDWEGCSSSAAKVSTMWWMLNLLFFRTASMLAKVAQLRGADMNNLTHLIGEKYAKRFGEAFLEVLEGG